VTKILKEEFRRVDEALRVWCQGDCILGKSWFVHRFAPALPLTKEAAKIAADAGAADIDLAESEVTGLMIASQSCDIVRSSADRPFVEVCPLVQLDEAVLKEVERGRRPQFAFVPGIATRGLAADLDRVMTVEKAIIAGWERTPGCDDDKAKRRLASALARKRVRFAFPDDFAAFAKKLQSRLADKHDKNSNEGRGLRDLREIRVRAAPSWYDQRVNVFFWFILNDDAADCEGMSWTALLNDWLKLVPASGRFRSVDGLVVALEDLTARDYVESDPLDLDHLSTRED
jgi:hypothetical protein